MVSRLRRAQLAQRRERALGILLRTAVTDFDRHVARSASRRQLQGPGRCTAHRARSAAYSRIHAQHVARPRDRKAQRCPRRLRAASDAAGIRNSSRRRSCRRRRARPRTDPDSRWRWRAAVVRRRSRRRPIRGCRSPCRIGGPGVRIRRPASGRPRRCARPCRAASRAPAPCAS